MLNIYTEKNQNPISNEGPSSNNEGPSTINDGPSSNNIGKNPQPENSQKINPSEERRKKVHFDLPEREDTEEEVLHKTDLNSIQKRLDKRIVDRSDSSKSKLSRWKAKREINSLLNLRDDLLEAKGLPLERENTQYEDEAERLLHRRR